MQPGRTCGDQRLRDHAQRVLFASWVATWYDWITMKDEAREKNWYDVLLSHNSKDKPAVRELAGLLSAQGLRVWLDEDELRPGVPWQQLLEQGIKVSRSVAVLVGKDGLGPWEDEEMQAALYLAVKDKRPVIPVLMCGASAQPELPMFLGNRTWVDLRTGFTKQGLAKLVWGITGQKLAEIPEHPQTRTVPSCDETSSEWVFVQLPSGEVRAHNENLCRVYAEMDQGDILEISARWREMAQRFTESAKRTGHYHGHVAHDGQIRRITKLLEMAVSERAVEGASCLGRCLRRPDDGHLHWALATLDELDAKLRVEICNRYGAASGDSPKCEENLALGNLPDMPPDDRRNSGVILLMLLAQAYYKMLECTISVAAWCAVLDLELNHSYFWSVRAITNLLKNHEDLKDFPTSFEPILPNLYPSTIRDLDWEDTVGHEAEQFLSTVQEYFESKGAYEPEKGSPGWAFIELFRPGVNAAVERALAYNKRMREHIKQVLDAPPKTTRANRTQSDCGDTAMEDDKRRLVRTFACRIAKGTVKSIPVIGAILEEAIFGVMEAESARKESLKLQLALQRLQQLPSPQEQSPAGLIKAVQDEARLNQKAKDAVDSVLKSISGDDADKQVAAILDQVIARYEVNLASLDNNPGVLLRELEEKLSPEVVSRGSLITRLAALSHADIDALVATLGAYGIPDRSVHRKSRAAKLVEWTQRCDGQGIGEIIAAARTLELQGFEKAIPSPE